MPNLEALSCAKGLNGAAAMQGILAESVDNFRTILLQQSCADAPKVLMVTSAGDREGKTTVASHLAASLARSGRRTLLVDGDLRSPTIHAMFSAALEPGVCEMLRGEADLESVIQPTQVDGLMLVAAGQCDYHAIASLSKTPLKEVLQKAREQFEFVIIDAAPILTYADTLLLGAHVDAAVLSVRRDVSQMHKVHEAKERLESVGIRVLGAVVNGITEPAAAQPTPCRRRFRVFNFWNFGSVSDFEIRISNFLEILSLHFGTSILSWEFSSTICGTWRCLWRSASG